MERLETRDLLSGVYPTINLAQFQSTTADSSADNSRPEEATDGIVSNESRWFSNSGSGGHWLEVELTAPYPVGSAQLFLGKDDGLTVASFEIQYHEGGAWQTIASVTGNTATDLNLVFPSVVDSATRFRFYTDEAIARVKEFVLLPPTDDPQGHPLGAGVNVNLASLRAPIASSSGSGAFPLKAVDGHIGNDSLWSPATASGTHTIEFNTTTLDRIGSLHVYSGLLNDRNTSPLSDFTIEYASGSGWTPIAGGTVSSGVLSGNQVSGNTDTELEVVFSEPVLANKIRLSFTGQSTPLREVVVLPPNLTESGDSGYPLGVSVSAAAAPTTEFAAYGDDWYRIASRLNDGSLVADAAGATQAIVSTPDEQKRFQFLYSYALDAYRIVSNDTGRALEVAGASRDAGAAIVEGDYSAAPHQLWRLAPTSDGFFQIVNVWSGLVMETDAGSPAIVTQQQRDLSADPADSQEWRPVFQDDYFKKGTGGWVGQYNTGWAYDWARNDRTTLDPEFFYAPMQHREGWPNLGALHRKHADWNNDVWPNFLLGFNEPDRPDQANMSVSRALELWPRLTALDVPLVSPAPALGGEDWWLTPFMDQADSLGYRTDYAGGHWYSSPSVDGLFSHINDLQNDGNGREVWLTEFSVVDWSGGSGDWSEETNYNFILEFLWRAETKNNLDKYAIFLFSGGSPANPWDLTNPRSNFFSGGSLTPFGKAYAGWDGVTEAVDSTSYVIHNRHARHRLQNNETSTLDTASIRTEDASVQWSIEDAGGGKKHIVSTVDGRRLSYSNGVVGFGSSTATGADVEWTIQQERHGWHNIVHSATGELLRLVRQNDANNAPVSLEYEMIPASEASGFTSTDWWFVKPWNAATPFDPTSPEVSNLVFNGDTDQSISVELSEEINTLTFDLGDFVVRNLDTGQTLGQRDVDVSNLTATGFTIEMLKAPLADGNWEVEILAGGFSDDAGNGNVGYTAQFQVLMGDADGNGAVDTQDADAWRLAYGSTTDLTSDWNRDGVVNSLDYTLLRENMGATLAQSSNASLVEVWRESYGSTTDLSADVSGDGVVNAADYTVLRGEAIAAVVATLSPESAYAVTTPPTAAIDHALLLRDSRLRDEAAEEFDPTEEDADDERDSPDDDFATIEAAFAV